MLNQLTQTEKNEKKYTIELTASDKLCAGRPARNKKYNDQPKSKAGGKRGRIRHKAGYPRCWKPREIGETFHRKAQTGMDHYRTGRN